MNSLRIEIMILAELTTEFPSVPSRSLFGWSARPQSRSTGAPALKRGNRETPRRKIAGLGMDGGPGAPPCAPGGG